MAKRIFVIEDEEVANAIEVLLEAKQKVVRRSSNYNPQGTFLDRGHSRRNIDEGVYSVCGVSFGACGGGGYSGCGALFGSGWC